MNCRALLLALPLAVAHCSLCLAAPGDQHWAPTFGPPGPTNSVFALALKDDRVFASGYWASGGPISTNNWIEVWDGNRWSTLPGLFNGQMPIYDALFIGENLYVCGLFTRLDGQTFNGIAQWNGTNWLNIGSIQGLGLALATDGTNLYLGGTFTNVGGVDAINVARWDGSVWSRLGDGLGANVVSLFDGFVAAVHWHEGALYGGGTFTNSGSATVKRLGRWNGSQWVEVSGGMDEDVYALATGPGNLYAGGAFQNAGGTAARGVARWDGNSWHPLGSGVIGNLSGPAVYSGPVFTIGVLGNDVIVGGSLTNAGGIRVSRIARWDGVSWHSMGVMNDLVERIRVSGTNAYIGGLFNLADDYHVNHLTRWDGTRFYPLGEKGKTEGAVFPGTRTLAAGQGKIYIGGIFPAIGDIQASRIACWDGTNWSALGSGVLGTNTGTGTAVNAIAVSDSGEVFAGGSFTNAGGVEARNIARWDGNAWHPLGAGLPGPVNAIVVRGNEVFVGGNFTLQLGPTDFAFNLARWDGNTWSSLSGGAFFGTINNFFVNALALHAGSLYVGGSFVAAGFGGPTSTNIVRHDGNDWVAMDLGVNSNVNAIVVIGNDIYVGGRFSRAGSVTASRIARWDGNAWSALGSGVSGSGSFAVSALAAIGTDLYAGGSFTNAGGLAASRIAKWNGSAWSAMGQGMGRSIGSPSVLGLASLGSDLFVAGNFEGAGGKAAFYVAQWNETRDFDAVPLIRLALPGLLPGGVVQLNLTASGFAEYVVEFSSNLFNWFPLVTNPVSETTLQDPGAAGQGLRFYRARGN